MAGDRFTHGASWAVLVAFFTSLTACGGGEESTPPTTLVVPTTVPTTVVPTTAPPPTLPAQPPDQLSKAQLQELVAPVALYPDVVLASLLPATTFPDQVADAAAWRRQQQAPVQEIPEDRNWDGSVAGLLQFPDVLNWLDQNDPWEEQMGDAMTYQQGDVLQAIQDYRHLAQNAGNLKSNEYMKVTTDADQDIRIAPAQPDTVYVPQYDTAAVTQPQEKTGINPWLAFGGGAVVGALGAWALYSIFDDDDDDHHGGGRKKVVKTYNNYYYGGSGQRPPGGEWRPATRQARRARAGQVVRPRPVEPVYTTRSAPKTSGGLPPPKKRAGREGGAVAQPTQAPVPQPTAAPEGKEPRKGGGQKHGGGEKQGGGDKHGGGQRKQQAAPAPAPATREAAPAPASPQQKQGGQTKQGGQKKQDGQKKQGGENQSGKKKKKKGGGND